MTDNIYKKAGYGMDNSETPYLNGYDVNDEIKAREEKMARMMQGSDLKMTTQESMTIDEALIFKTELEKDIEDLINKFEEVTELDVHSILLWWDEEGNHVEVEAIL